MHLTFLALALFSAGFVSAAPTAGPTVRLDSATVTGKTALGVDSFLGIPFAEPP
jgi:acetylcholinesterase